MAPSGRFWYFLVLFGFPITKHKMCQNYDSLRDIHPQETIFWILGLRSFHSYPCFKKIFCAWALLTQNVKNMFEKISKLKFSNFSNFFFNSLVQSKRHIVPKFQPKNFKNGRDMAIFVWLLLKIPKKPDFEKSVLETKPLDQKSKYMACYHVWGQGSGWAQWGVWVPYPHFSLFRVY